MFVKSFKVSGRRLAAIGLMCAAVLALMVYGVGTRLAGRGGEVETGAKSSGKAPKNSAKTAAERAAFIRQLGWEIEEEPIEVVEIVLPKEEDEVYERYNELQKQQGFDLTKFRGERCMRYSYRVTNYPDTALEVRLSLIVLDGRVIGGDLASDAQGGFMRGFASDSPTLRPAQLEISLEEHGEPESEETAAQAELPTEAADVELTEEQRAMGEALAQAGAAQEHVPAPEDMPTD